MNSTESDSSSVDRLLDLAASGDDRAFQQLFERYRLHLERYIELRMEPGLRRRMDPSDVVQETLIASHRRIQEFHAKRPMPLRIWLRKTAQERLMNLREKHEAARRTINRECGLPQRSSLALAGKLIAPGPSPSQELLRRERQQAVAQAITKLSEQDREILLMRNMEDLTYEEVAVSLDITPAAARQRYGRALLRLQKQLRESGFGDSVP